MAKMIKCKTCGEEIAKSAKSCPKCGAKMKRKGFGWLLILLGVVIALAGGLSSNSSTTASKYSSMSEADIRSGSKTVNYEDVARNPDNFKGSLITFTGEVIQVMEGSTVTLRINQDNPSNQFASDTWYVTYKAPQDAARILVDDEIVVYGECTGTVTYKTVLGSQMTIPSMTLLYYDMV